MATPDCSKRISLVGPPLPPKKTSVSLMFFSPVNQSTVPELPPRLFQTPSSINDRRQWGTPTQQRPNKGPPLPPKLKPSLPEKKPTSDPSKNSEIQRANVIKELIDNEVLFNNQMSFISSIMTDRKISVEISEEDFKAIKINLDAYIDASSMMIRAYDQAKKETSTGNLAEACIGKHLLPVIPQFCKEMINYVKEFDPEILAHRPHLKEYFDQATELIQKSDGSFSCFLDRLYKPFQRPFQMKTFLDRIDKHTPETHPDSQSIKQLNMEIQNACDIADANKRKNVEYDDFSQDVTGEDDRLANYRKKQKRLSLLIEGLMKWIETNNKDVKILVETRRCLIKSLNKLDTSLFTVPAVFNKTDFPPTSITHRIPDFSSDQFDNATSDVLEHLKRVGRSLKGMNVPLKKLKARAKDLEKIRKNKSSYQAAVTKYRADVKSASTISASNLANAEVAVKALFLHYLAQVRQFFLFATIPEQNIAERYETFQTVPRSICPTSQLRTVASTVLKQVKCTKEPRSKTNSPSVEQIAALAVHKVGVGSRKNSCCSETGRVSVVGRSPSQGPKRRASEIASPKINAIIDAIKAASTIASAPTLTSGPLVRAQVVFAYSDAQTAVKLSPGDIVDVLELTDAVGSTEWALIRAKGSEQGFYFPSNRLTLIN